MKTFLTIALGAIFSLAAAKVVCPTVTREVLAASCTRECANQNCMYISTIVNPCGCRGVPTATLIQPCGASCPYSGCSVQYFRSNEPCVIETPTVDFVGTGGPRETTPPTTRDEVPELTREVPEPAETTTPEEVPEPAETTTLEEVPEPAETTTPEEVPEPAETTTPDVVPEPAETTTPDDVVPEPTGAVTNTWTLSTPTMSRADGSVTETAACPTVTSTVLPDNCRDLDCDALRCEYQQPFPIPCGCPRGEDIATEYVSRVCPRECPTGCSTTTRSITEDCIFASTWAA